MAIDWNMVLAALTAITIIIIVIWNGIQYRQMKKQLEIQNEQVRLNILWEYTKRWSNAFRQLPVDLYEEDYSIEDLDPERKDDVLRCFRELFDIIAEWFYLYQTHYVQGQYFTEREMKQWDEAIMVMSEIPAFKVAWKKFSKDPVLSEEFRDFMDSRLGD